MGVWPRTSGLEVSSRSTGESHVATSGVQSRLKAEGKPDVLRGGTYSEEKPKEKYQFPAGETGDLSVQEGG